MPTSRARGFSSGDAGAASKTNTTSSHLIVFIMAFPYEKGRAL